MIYTVRSIAIIFFISCFTPLTFGQEQNGPNKLYPILFNYSRDLYPEYINIPGERRVILEEIANYIIGSLQFEKESEILFLETDNSTRTIMAEAWATAASFYYGINHVKIYSGGINSSKISTNTIVALEKAGFIIYKTSEKQNPTYEIKYSYNVPPVIVTSKKYNNKLNPDIRYGSVFLCSNADINLPVVKGNNFRTSLHYFDPTAYNNSPEAPEKYMDRCHEIAIEMFYLFYVLKNAQ